MTSVSEDASSEVNGNYKPFSTCETLPSFQQLAELARSQDRTADQTQQRSVLPDSCRHTPAFCQPQNRPRFESCEGEEELKEKQDVVNVLQSKIAEQQDISMEELRLLKNGRDEECEDEREEVLGTECTDMKPSLFNFKGFLETLSLDLHLRYSMDNPRRGLAIIFNNDVFDSRLGLNPRKGSNADVRQLKRQFSNLAFEVYVYANLSLKDMKKAVKLASTVNHYDADSFVCIFLTHGDDDGIIYASDGSVCLTELLDEFRGNRCRSLVGKPKIFIIQACRGRELKVGVCETDSGGVEDTDARSVPDAMADTGTRATIPAGADFIVCYSVVEGYFSFCDTVSGSWYIQALCQTLSNYGTTLEFTALMTLVSRMVAEKCVKRSADSRMLGRKQMPCFVSMLTKQLVFTSK